MLLKQRPCSALGFHWPLPGKFLCSSGGGIRKWSIKLREIPSAFLALWQGRCSWTLTSLTETSSACFVWTLLHRFPAYQFVLSNWKPKTKHHNPPKQQKPTKTSSNPCNRHNKGKSKNCQGKEKAEEGRQAQKAESFSFYFSNHPTSGEPGLRQRGWNKIPKPIQQLSGSSRGQPEHGVPPSPNPVLPFRCL